jgi:SPP1 gp7 family putative phage head morphogenesis protein
LVELRPIRESTEDWDRLEAKLVQWFKAELYFPLLKILGQGRKRLTNASDDPLVDAIKSGRVVFDRGTFSGKFSAAISRDLRALGAKFDRRSGTYKLPLTELPAEIRAAVNASYQRYTRTMEAVDRKLAQILPAEIAESLQVSSIFDSSLWKVDRSFAETVKGIMVAPELTDERRKRLSEEWQDNMRLWIKDFTEKEISTLRKDLQKSAFSGNRFESVVKTIQRSYGVSHNKAKFLARQETSLLMTKFQETRYTEAGVLEYRWGCVKMPHDKVPGEHMKGNVRYSHGLLEGKIFRWSDPPVTTNPGEPTRRNNPGQDYNCRCFAIPVVRA